MTVVDNYFITLSKIDLSEYEEKKNGLDFLPWAVAWEELKKKYPNAVKKDYPQIMDEYGNTRFWHDDGRSGWVELGVEINGHEEKLHLAIMDHRNQPIAADKITATDANKAYMRCLVKVLALHGIGLYIYRKEDAPQAVKELSQLQDDCMSLIKKKSSLSDDNKKQVEKLCKEIDDDANGDPRLIEDSDKLKLLKKQLLAIRKAPSKSEE